MMNDPTEYAGNELALFAKAIHWKKYYSKFLRPHLTGRVLEVGSGLGSTTAFLNNGTYNSWTCIEPDKKLASHIGDLIHQKKLPGNCCVFVGTIDNLPSDKIFDTIIYIDVIEHIEDDASELLAATHKLAHGGKLIILVPAYNWLFNSFDKKIGHYRRYSKLTLKKIVPSQLDEIMLLYLDSVGLLASVANKLFLKQDCPSKKQIKIWDGIFVPISKIIDPFGAYSFGKSLIGIWEKAT